MRQHFYQVQIATHRDHVSLTRYQLILWGNPAVGVYTVRQMNQSESDIATGTMVNLSTPRSHPNVFAADRFIVLSVWLIFPIDFLITERLRCQRKTDVRERVARYT